MNTPDFETVAKNVFLLKIPLGEIWTGVYLFRGPQKILIDSGLNSASVDSFIIPALKKIGLTPRNIDYLLCTHSHGDHIGGHARLQELGVRHIGVWKNGFAKLCDPLKYSKLIRAEFPEYSPSPPAVLNGVTADLILKDGDKIGGLQLTAAPGHDSDCVCWFEPENGILLSGDSIQGNGTDMQGCALYMNLADYKNTLNKLSRLPAGTIITGHPYLPWNTEHLDAQKAIGECLELLKKYDTFLHAETDRETASLATKLIRRLNGKIPDKLFLAMYTIREHLRQI